MARCLPDGEQSRMEQAMATKPQTDSGRPVRGREPGAAPVPERRRKQDAPRPPGSKVRERGPDSGSGNLRPDKP
jgi:hypothetical protein